MKWRSSYGNIYILETNLKSCSLERILLWSFMHVPACCQYTHSYTHSFHRNYTSCLLVSLRFYKTLSGLEGAVGALKKGTETTYIHRSKCRRWPGPCTAFRLELDIHSIPIQDVPAGPPHIHASSKQLLVCNVCYLLKRLSCFRSWKKKSRLLSCQHLFFVFRSALREHDRSVRLAKIWFLKGLF